MQRFNEHTNCGTDECCGTCSSLIENNIYRVGSERYYEYFREAREQYHAGNLEVDAADLDIIESNLGEFAQWRGENVALDCIFEAEEKKPIGKPMRGGPKKYYVYVKTPNGNVKKVSWGDTTGLKVKLNDPKARKSFAARHRCDQQNDKTKAAYWACRLPRYAKQLGLSGGGSFFW
jgi:hypothetical protein